MERGLLAGLAAFRWAAWAWMATLVVVTRESLEHPLLAAGLVALALVVTAVLTVLLRVDERRLRSAPLVSGELLVGGLLLLADGIAYGEEHSQSLGSAWPLAGVLAAAVLFGRKVGIAAGLLLGLARLGGVLARPYGDGGATDLLSVASSAVLYALAGGIAGYAAHRLREAERQISAARAREEVARHLHDGVLQTLAVVQRRAEDTDLVRLARNQERDLRDYLFGTRPHGGGDLGPALRAAAARFEDVFGGRAEVTVADDLPRLRRPACDALVGAVGEALTNAGKHGRARRVVVYVEPTDDGGTFCSVKDDGVGFDPAAVEEGIGLARSIRGRMAEVGGRVDLAGRPGHGAEVRLWLP